jgi:hypothetical protein
MESDTFFVYLNLDPFATSWAVYRGVMCSAATIGTRDFRTLAYWPFNLLKRAARGDLLSLRRLEKELSLEQVRRAHYAEKVSRLHGIYLWRTRNDAIRGERWRLKEGQHFAPEQLAKVEFYYTNRTEVDTQWIDEYVLDDAYVLNRGDLSWAHRYWGAEARNDNPHWEQLVEGRGVIRTTALRQRALQKIETEFPRLLGEAELGRLAAELGSDLNVVAPFIVFKEPGILTANYFVDARDQTPDFMTRLGQHIQALPNETVHRRALELLRNGIQYTADLRKEGFDFDLDLLSEEGRSQIYGAVPSRDSIDWTSLQLISTPTVDPAASA